MNNIIMEINKNILSDKNIDKIHVQNIYKRKYDKEFKIRSLICPICGSELIIRKGIYGKFYGCSKYPNCKFTTNI